MPGQKKSGREISVYLPYEKLDQIQKAKGNYITTSKFILWCLEQVLDGKIEKTPLGASVVPSQAPNSLEDSSSPSSNTLTTLPAKDVVVPNQEGLTSVS
jgi:hypothetical protein